MFKCRCLLLAVVICSSWNCLPPPGALVPVLWKGHPALRTGFTWSTERFARAVLLNWCTQLRPINGYYNMVSGVGYKAHRRCWLQQIITKFSKTTRDSKSDPRWKGETSRNLVRWCLMHKLQKTGVRDLSDSEGEGQEARKIEGKFVAQLCQKPLKSTVILCTTKEKASSRNYVKGPRTWYLSDWYSINDTRKKESGLTASLVRSNDCLWLANLESSEIRWLGIVLLEEYGLMIWEVSCSRSRILIWPVLMTTAERSKQLNCRSTNLLQQWAQAQKVNQGFRRYRKIANSRRKRHVLVSSVDTAIHLLTQTGVLPLARNAWSARNRDTLQPFGCMGLVASQPFKGWWILRRGALVISLYKWYGMTVASAPVSAFIWTAFPAILTEIMLFFVLGELDTLANSIDPK